MAVYPYTVEHNGIWYPPGTNVPVEPPAEEKEKETEEIRETNEAAELEPAKEEVLVEPPAEEKPTKKNKKA